VHEYADWLITSPNFLSFPFLRPFSPFISLFDYVSDEKDIEGLKAWYKGVHDYADGVGVWKDNILTDPFHPPTSSNIVSLAQKENLFVHVYTFRSDIKFLHVAYGGNPTEEYMLFFRLGIDGVYLLFCFVWFYICVVVVHLLNIAYRFLVTLHLMLFMVVM
jgi:hypothetical protein